MTKDDVEIFEMICISRLASDIRFTWRCLRQWALVKLHHSQDLECAAYFQMG